jgi:putative tricarboxylic transport membrane protein
MQSELIANLGIAVGTILDPVNLLLLLAGTAIGLVMGMLPGLGGTVTIALLTPLTFSMDPLIAFMLLVAANGGTSQGGAITAILLNTPGKAPNAATLLDGYPMTRQGRGAEAVTASATSSGVGAILGLSVLLFSIPVVLRVALAFGPPEIFWLGVWGLSVIALVVGDRLRTGLISAGLGMMFAMHGVNGVTGGFRWTYGIAGMLEGVPLVPALVGLFAVSEMINLLVKGETIASDSDDIEIGEGRWTGVRQVFVHKWLFLRSAALGAGIGIIPGVGGTAANYLAYFQAVQTSDDPESFGKGNVAGVIAAEAANDAKEGGAYIPTLGFGIPGSSSMALLFAAFLLHGIRPGPLLMANHLDLVMVILVSALVSNVVSSGMVIGMVGQLVKVTYIDIRVLAPLVMAVAFLAAYALQNNPFNIWVTLVFGVLGYLMMHAEMSRIPMILAIVLGPIVEQNYFRSLQISQGNHAVFVESPVSWLLILLIPISLVLPYARVILEKHGVVS